MWGNPFHSFPHVLTASHIRGTNFRLDLSHSFIRGNSNLRDEWVDAPAYSLSLVGCQRGRPNSPGSILESRFSLASAPPPPQLRLHGADQRGLGRRSCSPLIMEFNVNSITRLPALSLGRRLGRKERHANEEHLGEGGREGGRESPLLTY